MERLYYLSNWPYCHKDPVIPRVIMLVIRVGANAVVVGTPGGVVRIKGKRVYD